MGQCRLTIPRKIEQDVLHFTKPPPFQKFETHIVPAHPWPCLRPQPRRLLWIPSVASTLGTCRASRSRPVAWALNSPPAGKSFSTAVAPPSPSSVGPVTIRGMYKGFVKLPLKICLAGDGRGLSFKPWTGLLIGPQSSGALPGCRVADCTGADLSI